MDRLETRELAYFVAVAETRHFGRAARQLGIAQPPLSRAIKQLERRLGVALLERDSRQVSLTPAGTVLLAEGRTALAAMAAAARRTQQAGQGAEHLVLVMKAGGDGGLLGDILAAYATHPDAVRVEVEVCRTEERVAMLHDGRADVGLLHHPHSDLRGLDTRPLVTERQVAVVARQHHLATRDQLHLADLAGETLPRWPGKPSEGSGGPVVTDAGQLMQLIALGRTVAVVPESVRTQLRDDLVSIPVLDAPPTTVLLAWPQSHTSAALDALVKVAETVVAGHTTQPATATPPSETA